MWFLYTSTLQLIAAENTEVVDFGSFLFQFLVRVLSWKKLSAASQWTVFLGNMKVAEDFAHDLVERARQNQRLQDMIIKDVRSEG